MADKFHVSPKGLERLRAQTKKLGRVGIRAFNEAKYKESLFIMADSVPRTPVVTSRLRNSQFVTPPASYTKDSSVQFGYGTNYAYRVHEGLTTRVKDLPDDARRAFWAQHKDEEQPTWKTSEVGGPNFLRDAVNATRKGRIPRMRRDIDRAIKRLNSK